MESVVCPACGRRVKLTTDPAHPGYLTAYCECNPIGPVVQKWVGEQQPAASDKKEKKGE
jgi:hypothetical protein